MALEETTTMGLAAVTHVSLECQNTRVTKVRVVTIVTVNTGDHKATNTVIQYTS